VASFEVVGSYSCYNLLFIFWQCFIVIFFGSVLLLYFTLLRSGLEYATVAWTTSTNANKLERIQRKFLALYYNRFFA
jgi:hypothetical protein